jgi:hypothetical protein
MKSSAKDSLEKIPIRLNPTYHTATKGKIAKDLNSPIYLCKSFELKKPLT